MRASESRPVDSTASSTASGPRWAKGIFSSFGCASTGAAFSCSGCHRTVSVPPRSRDPFSRRGRAGEYPRMNGAHPSDMAGPRRRRQGGAGRVDIVDQGDPLRNRPAAKFEGASQRASTPFSACALGLRRAQSDEPHRRPFPMGEQMSADLLGLIESAPPTSSPVQRHVEHCAERIGRRCEQHQLCHHACACESSFEFQPVHQRCGGWIPLTGRLQRGDWPRVSLTPTAGPAAGGFRHGRAAARAGRVDAVESICAGAAQVRCRVRGKAAEHAARWKQKTLPGGKGRGCQHSPSVPVRASARYTQRGFPTP